MKNFLIIFFCAFSVIVNAQITGGSKIKTTTASGIVTVTMDSIKSFVTDTLYVLATGQSNMVGYGYGGDTTINPKVQVFETMSNQWQVATRKNVHDSLQLYAGFVSYGHYATENNSLAWCFAKNLQKKTGKPVKLLVSAMGGQPITQWAIGQPQWTRITTTLSSSNIPRVDVILWLQGEGDAANGNNITNWNYYVNALTTVISNLRNLSVCNNQTPIILNKLIPANYDFFNGLYDKVANPTNGNQQPYVGVNSSFGLTSIGDAVHYSGGALDTLGQRALSVYLSLPNTIKTTSIIVPVSTRNETTNQSGLMLISNAGRDSSSGTAINFGVNYFGVNSPITSGGRILVTSSDTNTISGNGGSGKMTLGVKYGYGKEGLSQSLFQTDAITIVPGLIGINNPSPQYALDIKPFFPGANPLAIRSMNSYPLYTNNIVCAASDASGGYLYRLTDNVLITDASGKIAPSSITNLSTSTNTGFKVMGNLTGTMNGAGLELTYGGSTALIYPFDRTAGNATGLTLSLGGQTGGYNVIGGLTANTSYTNTITGGNTLVAAGLDVTGTLNANGGLNTAGVLTANAKLNANANAKILGTFENYQNTTFGNSTYAVSIGNGGASDNYFKGDNTYWQNSSGGSLATLNATGLGLGTSAAYKLDVLSSADPLRLTGLQTGASTDDVLSSASGVLKRNSLGNLNFTNNIYGAGNSYQSQIGKQYLSYISDTLVGTTYLNRNSVNDYGFVGFYKNGTAQTYNINYYNLLSYDISEKTQYNGLGITTNVNKASKTTGTTFYQYSNSVGLNLYDVNNNAGTVSFDSLNLNLKGANNLAYNIKADSLIVKPLTGINFQGVKYAADYSTNYTTRSLVDKAYVDAKFSNTTFTTYNSAIASGTETTIAITVTGLTTSGEVSSSFSGTKPQGLIVMPVEKSANTVTFHLYNATGASITPNITLSATVLKY